MFIEEVAMRKLRSDPLPFERCPFPTTSSAVHAPDALVRRKQPAGGTDECRPGAEPWQLGAERASTGCFVAGE